MIANANNGGGVGEEYPQQTKSANSRLERKAIKLGWIIPEDDRPELISGQIEIAKDPTLTPRERTSAFKAIVSANSQNVQLAIARLDNEEDHSLAPIDTRDLVAAMRTRTIPNAD